MGIEARNPLTLEFRDLYVYKISNLFYMINICIWIFLLLIIGCATSDVEKKSHKIEPSAVTSETNSRGVLPAPTSIQMTATPALNPLFHYSAGFRLIEMGEFKQALARFNLVNKVYSDFAGGFYGRGLAYYHLDQLEKAISEFNQALAIDPKYSNGYYGLAMVAYKRGKLVVAKGELDKAINLSTKNANVYFLRAEILKQLDEKPLAIQDLETAIKFFGDPDDKAKANIALEEMQK